MKRILYIFICTAVWLMCIPGANAQVNDKALTRSGEVGTYNGTRADFLTVAGKLSRYPKLSKAGESLKYAPIVSTDSVPEAFITAESARVYGNILFNGWFENVTAKGFELSTNADFPETATVQYPVVSETNQYVECDQPCTQNVFDLVIDQLQSSTTYYVRAFATNAKGTSYGETLTFTTLTAMNVAALPYFTDFSEEGDNENWFLNNGNCTNYWMMGTDLLNQNPALFITTNGETPGYNDLKPVTVMAERLLLMDASDSLTINLDVRMYGESSYDYLKVFLAPKSMLFSAADTNVTPYSGHSYSQYALRFPSGDYSYVTDNDGSRYLHLSCLIDNPLSAGDTAKLVFLWCNDRSTLREPPAIISSVEVIPLRIKTDSVSDITYNAAAVYSTMTTTLTENLQRGLCYSKYPGVTLGGENCINVVLDQLNGSYSYNLTDLVPNTKYYVRAYALSGNGVISYGDELSFQTKHNNFVATVPYRTNFSDGYDWLVEHTISTTQNYWNFGLLTDYTDSAMYVTYNDGTQAQYYTSATTNISAGRLLRMPQTDSVHVTFYVNCGGEGSYDWMKVLLVPVNEDITTDHYAFDYNTNAMDFSNYLSQTGNQDGPYKLNLTDGTLRIAANLKNPTLQDGDTAKLVFLWHTDGGSGNQPGPIITDLYVSVLDVDVYTDSVSDITDKSANVYGHIYNPKNEVISKVGVCYSKHINPTFEDNIVESTIINADNTFLLPISNLDYNTTYYVRTFMMVDNEVFFGDQTKFMSRMAVVPDELPYVTDFSDRQQWWMNSGDCQNYWKTGKLTEGGDSMLFITNDAQYFDTCGYAVDKYTFVTAEKYLKMPDSQNPIELTFDVNVGGESSYDYLMVYLCPKNQEFTPNSTTSVEPVTTYAFDFRHYKNVASGSTDLSRYYFNLTNNSFVHINDLVNNPVPGDTAKLVFLWRTDGSAGTQPGPVISNLSVTEYVTDNVLPYSTNFSSENEEWILYSGASKNYFMTGVPAGTTQSALFVTHDGETCSYNTGWQSFTMAETYFSFPENDSLLLEFDAKAGGEDCCDYLMAFVSNWDVEYNYNNVANATSDNMGAVPFIGYSSEMSSSNTNTYRIQLTNGNDMHHFSVKVKNPARNGLGKLVFAWRNDGSSGTAPYDVMVTNVSLTEVEAPQATKPTVNTIGSSYYQENNDYIMEGEVVSDGGSALTARGVCYSDINSEPTLLNSSYFTSSSTQVGTFAMGLSAGSLTPGATYYFRAYATNAVGTAYGETMSFTVAAPVTCEPITDFPWSEGFENGGNIPDCWSQEYVSGEVNWTYKEGSYQSPNSNSIVTSAHSGNYNAYLFEHGYGFATKLITPMFDLANVTNPKLTFWHTQEPWGSDQDVLKVYYRTSQTAEWQPLAEYSSSINEWVSESIPLPAATSTYQVAFEGNLSYGYGITLDDITVSGAGTSDAFTCGTSTIEDYDGNVYNTVQIGDQCWMKQNLRTTHFANGDEIIYATPSGSHMLNEPPYYYDNTESAIPLEDRGYFYNFFAVMHNDDPSEANPSGVQGICPEGWHMPSLAEWEQLVQTAPIGPETDFSMVYAGYPTDFFVEENNAAVFWTASPGDTNTTWGFPIPQALRCRFYSNYSDLGAPVDYTGAYSVRCVKDAEQPAHSFSCGDNLIDGDNSYATIQLGDYCWMKENLRTEVTSGHSSNSIYTSESVAYSYYPDGEVSNVANYGYLYNWTAALAGMNSSEGVQGICPDGWHLPTEAEANDLKLRVTNSTSTTGSTFFGDQYAGLFKIGDGGSPFKNFSTDAWLWVTAYFNGDYNAILAIGLNSSNNIMKNSRRDIGAAIRCVMNADDGDNTESCPSLGVSQEAHSITAQYVYSPVIDFDADKINNDYCGYGVFAGGSNVLIVRGKDYPNLVNTSFIEDNGSYNLWVTIDFNLIATAAQSNNVQVSSGDPITIMPILNLDGCPESESFGSTVILTMP